MPKFKNKWSYCAVTSIELNDECKNPTNREKVRLGLPLEPTNLRKPNEGDSTLSIFFGLYTAWRPSTYYPIFPTSTRIYLILFPLQARQGQFP